MKEKFKFNISKPPITLNMNTHNTPDSIKRLIETFDYNMEAYKKGLNETQLRREFIDPFF